jgi:hypothetical protein
MPKKNINIFVKEKKKKRKNCHSKNASKNQIGWKKKSVGQGKKR